MRCLLEVMLILKFGFHADFPYWLYGLAILNDITEGFVVWRVKVIS